MLKLYRRQGGRITHYHEAWASKSAVTEHWGELGTRGEQRTHPLKKKKSDANEMIRKVLQPAMDSGFTPADSDGHQIVLVEYKIDGFGTAEDIKKRHDLEDRLNETLGWTGLGHVDGGSIGSGTMEVACHVVDVEVAKRVLAEDLDGTKFGDFSRIAAEGAG